jgi:hypothetical protein
MNSPVMRMRRQVSVRVKSSGRATPCERLSSFVLGDGREVRVADGVVDDALDGGAAGRRRPPRLAVPDLRPLAHAFEGLPPGLGQDFGAHLLAAGGAGHRGPPPFRRSLHQRRAAATQASTSSSLRGIFEERLR